MERERREHRAWDFAEGAVDKQVYDGGNRLHLDRVEERER
jgi:hypothetical protein